jgi:hypothetical protein
MKLSLLTLFCIFHITTQIKINITNCSYCNYQLCELSLNTTIDLYNNNYDDYINSHTKCICNINKCGSKCGNSLITGKKIKSCVKKIYCDIIFSKLMDASNYFLTMVVIFVAEWILSSTILSILIFIRYRNKMTQLDNIVDAQDEETAEFIENDIGSYKIHYLSDCEKNFLKKIMIGFTMFAVIFVILFCVMYFISRDIAMKYDDEELLCI